MTPEEQEEAKADLFNLLKDFNEFSSHIQNEMSAALLLNEGNRNDLEKQLKLPENDMEIIINKAVYDFIGVMPLASMNKCNLFSKVIALHTNLTGDESMHVIYDKINQQIIDEMDYN